MVLSLEELGRHEFALGNIEALRRRPTYRSCTIRHRQHSGFLYIINGACTVQAGGEEISLTPGALLYLPYGLFHTMTLTTPRIEFYRVDFNVKVGDELVLFSTHPAKLCDTLHHKGHDAILALEEACAHGNNNIVKTERLCALFSALCPTAAPVYRSKLGAAVRYLDEHFTEPLDCRALASLCFLSTAQFYNLFRELLGMTPLEYRDTLLLRRAKALLTSDEVTVTEAASLLGFSSVAYFSRFFKKHVGLAPSAFAEQQKAL